MNFKWKNDIYNEGYSEETEKLKKGEEDHSLLPNFCKPMGLFIALAPLLFKASQLFFPLHFLKSIHLSDSKLLCIIGAGLLIEVWSKTKVETFDLNLRRLFLTAVIGFPYVTVVVGFITRIWNAIF